MSAVWKTFFHNILPSWSCKILINTFFFVLQLSLTLYILIFLKVRGVHLKDQKHTCPYCHVFYTRDFDTRRHIQIVHLQNYKCEICNKVFGSNLHLTKHVKSLHLDHKCQYCQEEFSDKYRLTLHVRFLYTFCLFLSVFKPFIFFSWNQFNEKIFIFIGKICPWKRKRTSLWTLQSCFCIQLATPSTYQAISSWNKWSGGSQMWILRWIVRYNFILEISPEKRSPRQNIDTQMWSLWWNI